MRTPLLILTFLVILSSCTKEENYGGGNTHYTINEKLFPLIFTEDSYWIYTNSNNLLYDSVILQGLRIDTIGPSNIGKGYSATWEECEISYVSSYYGDYTEHFASAAILRGSPNGGCIYKASFSIGDDCINATIAEIHDSILVNEVTYYRVVEMDVTEADSIDTNMKLFFKDSVGIVKKVLYHSSIDSTCWDLIEFETKLFYE